jgi:hypothetical protein
MNEPKDNRYAQSVGQQSGNLKKNGSTKSEKDDSNSNGISLIVDDGFTYTSIGATISGATTKSPSTLHDSWTRMVL